MLRTISVAFATAALIACTFAPNALADSGEAFLRIDGVQGESKDTSHRDEIELVTWGLSDPQLKNNTACVGRKRLELTITKPLDKTSPRFFQAFGSGEHLREAKLTIRRGKSTSSEFLKYRLLELKVVSYSLMETDSGPLEQVVFNFGKAEMEYVPQKPDGTNGSPVVSHYE